MRLKEIKPWMVIDGQYSMDFDGTDLVGFKEKGI